MTVGSVVRDRNKVIVLDRDGTIVVDRHYLSDPEDLRFEPRAELALRRMVDMGYRLVIVTNQSGIGRRLFSTDRLEEIHQRLRRMLEDNGTPVAAIYSCPHVPDDRCACRKPKLGLMTQAAGDLGFDMAKAIVIGDKDSDVEFGNRAGAVSILIRPASDAADSATAAPTYVVKDLAEAADVIGGLDRRAG